MTVSGIDAVLLSGGSLFGLDAAGGAVSFLRAAGPRHRASARVNVPIAVQATTFDLLNGGDKDWGRMPPYWELGWQATAAASSAAFALGTAGGGYGATTATLKGGLGSASAIDGVGLRRRRHRRRQRRGLGDYRRQVRTSGPRPARSAPSSAAWASPRTCRRRR